MKLSGLRLHNFRSYADAGIEFSEGQNYIFGRNWQGKTSIMDGIGYALFGRRLFPPRLAGASVRTEHLVRNGAQSGWVELAFEHRGEEYRLRRTCPKDMPSLSLDNRRIAQGATAVGEHLHEMLGIDATLFSNIFYSQQDDLRRVLEMSPEGRRVFIEAMLGFEYLKDVKTAAKRSSDALQRWLDGFLSTDIGGAQERSRTVLDRLDEISGRIERLNVEIAALGSPERAVSDSERMIQDQVRHWEEKGALRERLDQHQNLLRGIESGTCPTCLQGIPMGAEKTLTARIRSTLSETERDLKRAEEKVLQMGLTLAEAERLRNGVEEDRVKVAELHAERDALQDELAFQRKNLESLRCEIAAYEDRTRIERRIDEERNFLAEVQLAIDEFRGNVRSVMAQNLENAANSFMRKFSDGDFDAELRITEDFGFETLLHGEQVPLSNLSGAARDILAFSLRYGLYRISAKEVSFLLLDEPTHHFDRSNTRKLKEALNELTDHQVIIITVNNEFSDAMGRKFMVEKDSAYNSVIRAL